MTMLWEGATEEEREELMQAMVVRVEMDEKKKEPAKWQFCRRFLLLLLMVGTNSENGSGGWI